MSSNLEPIKHVREVRALESFLNDPNRGINNLYYQKGLEAIPETALVLFCSGQASRLKTEIKPLEIGRAHV